MAKPIYTTPFECSALKWGNNGERKSITAAYVAFVGALLLSSVGRQSRPLLAACKGDRRLGHRGRSYHAPAPLRALKTATMLF